MDLRMRPKLAADYKSPSQIARVLTEDWVVRNLYCPACTSNHLAPTRTGTRVVDFVCHECEDRFQLKSSKNPFGPRVTDAAYGPMIDSVRRGTNPNFILLHYQPTQWVVRGLLVIPQQFFSESCIHRRKPLSPNARRAGWVGCDIMLNRLPHDARVVMIHGGRIKPVSSVRRQFERFRFLKGRVVQVRGWLADVLRCVSNIGRRQFTLDEVYAYEQELAALHPRNHRVRDKIRQQLQVLRDRGMLRFVRRGVYRLIS